VGTTGAGRLLSWRALSPSCSCRANKHSSNWLDQSDAISPLAPIWDEMLKSRRIPIGVKLGGLSAALLALTAIVTVVAIVSLNTVAGNGDALYTSSVQPLASLSDARATINLNRLLASKYSTAATDAERAKLKPQIEANRKAISASLAELRGQIDTPAERQSFGAMNAAYNAYVPIVDRSCSCRPAAMRPRPPRSPRARPRPPATS
jgi:hypothetical protein